MNECERKMGEAAQPARSSRAEQALALLVPAFYARVRADALLGPVFDKAISDWGHHVGRLVDFWSSVMLASGRYKGQPMAAHTRHRETITPEMFDRWLALWCEVTDEILPREAAEAMQLKAVNIAESLKLGLYFRLPKPTTQ